MWTCNCGTRFPSVPMLIFAASPLSRAAASAISAISNVRSSSGRSNNSTASTRRGTRTTQRYRLSFINSTRDNFQSAIGNVSATRRVWSWKSVILSSITYRKGDGDSLQVGIIGCGVAGQAAAIALSRQGHNVTIVERFAQARPVGAGLLLQPSGLAVLERLGLRAEAENWGAPIQRLEGNTGRGRRVLALDYGRQHGLGIHRGALFNVLHNAVQASGARLLLGFEVVSIDNPDDPVLVARDGRREGPFDVVLDCAGAHDAARDHLGLAISAPLYPWGAFWCAVPDRDGRWTEALRQTYDGAHTMMGILPIGRAPDTDTRCVA